MAAYVTDVADSPSLPSNALVEVIALPPAPSPPSATPAVNVFDFLVPEKSPISDYSSASSFISARQEEHFSDYPGPGNAHGNGLLLHAEALYQHPGFEYGVGPVKQTKQRYDSEFDLNLGLEQKQARGYSTVSRTPAPQRSRTANGHDERQITDKKRKRPQVEDLDLAVVAQCPDTQTGPATILHSGLTGGLNKLLAKSGGRAEEASPLSPKKHSKHTRQTELKVRETERSHRHKESEERDHRHKRHREGSKSRSLEVVKAIEGSKDLKMIDYRESSGGALVKNIKSKQLPHLPQRSNSEFFLSLVDKDHHSAKGQSIWGALKMFHEGLQAAMSETAYFAAGIKEKEEKRLFSGLRMKINRSGEIVLFARPEKEYADPT